ncbi:MAG: hypothetical protein WCG87_09175 [Bacteroidota bacterium]
MPNIALVLIGQHYAQLQDLNYTISLRPQGERYPTTQEVSIMSRLLRCIKELRKEQILIDETEIPEMQATETEPDAQVLKLTFDDLQRQAAEMERMADNEAPKKKLAKDDWTAW